MYNVNTVKTTFAASTPSSTPNPLPTPSTTTLSTTNLLPVLGKTQVADLFWVGLENPGWRVITMIHPLRAAGSIAKPG